MGKTAFQPPVDSPYIQPYWWEQINFKATQQWMEEIWWYSFPICGVYIVLIHWIQLAMRTKKPMRLRGSLFLWNLGLAVFSIVATLRTVPEMMQFVGVPNSWHKSVCSRENQTIVTAFWSLMSAWSKVAELGDTLFVVLRKQPLIFLHWYHHTTVLLYTWYVFPRLEPANRWFLAMNFFIHAIMYSYYALKAAGLRIPRWFSMTITTMQTAQMVIGVSVNFYTFYAKWAGAHCDRRMSDVFWGTLMYLSYMVLFSHFFYKAYIRKSPKKTN